jgi:hypothetical protein
MMDYKTWLEGLSLPECKELLSELTGVSLKIFWQRLKELREQGVKKLVYTEDIDDVWMIKGGLQLLDMLLGSVDELRETVKMTEEEQGTYGGRSGYSDNSDE